MLQTYFFLANVIAGINDKRKSEEGATATEYGLLVAFIALAIIVGVTALGTELNTFFQGLATDVSAW